MEIIPISNLTDLSFPLPLYKSIKIGEAIAKDGDRFNILAGIDQAISLQLKEFSLDDNDIDLQQNTSDRKRFGEGLYEKWYSKNRTPFALVHSKTNELGALAWFGPKPLGIKSLKHLSDKELKEEQSQEAGNWHTISYRCYPNFRGQGLMKNFVAFVMDIYTKNFPGAKIWAGLNSKNVASDKLALSLGFKPVEEASDLKANWLVMVKE